MTQKEEKIATGVELIAKERIEQLSKHGYTLESDSENDRCEMAKVASILTMTQIKPGNIQYLSMTVGWDIGIIKKMASKPYKDRLIIAAEIDRLNFDRTLNYE